MVTGFKSAPSDTPTSERYRAVAAALVLALAAFGAWWFSYDLRAPQKASAAVAFIGPTLSDNALWREECGSCHLSFHPSLLPKRSWEKLLAQQNQHFGVDLGLESATTAALLKYALNNAAEKHQTEPALKIDSSLKADAVPLRITETPYWTKKHREILAVDWNLPWIKSKTHCEACHQDAQAGTFEDGAMSIPHSPPTVR